MRASSPRQARLATCRSSPSLPARCRSPSSPAVASSSGNRPASVCLGSSSSRPDSKASTAAHTGGSGSRPGTAPLPAEASVASSAASRGSLASGHSTLLQPTASYVAGVKEMRSRKEQRQLASQPSTHQPQVCLGCTFGGCWLVLRWLQPALVHTFPAGYMLPVVFTALQV